MGTDNVRIDAILASNDIDDVIGYKTKIVILVIQALQ